MKRFRPRAKGRASPIKKPFSRITIVLEEKRQVNNGTKNKSNWFKIRINRGWDLHGLLKRKTLENI